MTRDEYEKMRARGCDHRSPLANARLLREREELLEHLRQRAKRYDRMYMPEMAAQVRALIGFAEGGSK